MSASSICTFRLPSWIQLVFWKFYFSKHKEKGQIGFAEEEWNLQLWGIFKIWRLLRPEIFPRLLIFTWLFNYICEKEKFLSTCKLKTQYEEAVIVQRWSAQSLIKSIQNIEESLKYLQTTRFVTLSFLFFLIQNYKKP